MSPYLLNEVKRFLKSDDYEIYECRRCGCTLEEKAEECPDCGCEDIASYRLK
ncbi:hypothetical protein KY092_08215 [Natronomonas gomsonensis]|uniref:hypothetical protein n=1 Tax=Natronomonas gomsonensis TaxID=1046043 RepID=UPI0020CA7ADB|nr:hypothetical protein [Natronomonas gomsonensis]MCY4730542.1 hypothetical protein [Natronomonas gomsonensis]